MRTYYGDPEKDYIYYVPSQIIS